MGPAGMATGPLHTHVRIPGSRAGGTPPGSPSLPRSPPLRGLGLPQPRLGPASARPAGGGGARTCPSRPRPDNARESGARAARPPRSRQHSPFLRSVAAARPRRAPREGTGRGRSERSPGEPPRHEAQRPRSPRKHTARRSPLDPLRTAHAETEDQAGSVVPTCSPGYLAEAEGTFEPKSWSSAWAAKGDPSGKRKKRKRMKEERKKGSKILGLNIGHTTSE
ncbi:sterile alpha motif domain-containing protein 1-like [Sciurus carolinensis]|uniref:sterile alpha motif domain-containing protein 1-like n=1 Tax=Sciurus carolinensis TaxID=30640 RepID=UPI001FB2B460|nr:sterile alpha motif domain-containing protein 1-like [Sciurus carolinensis]